ncbi:GNAT superfamily N-acetyltransferase [Bradyrhizobium sp. USDA 4341]
MAFLIEPYRPEDFDTLSVLIGRLQEFEREWCQDRKPPAVVADPYSKFIVDQAAETGIVLIARDGEEAVGCIAGRLAEEDDPTVPEEERICALISDLYVADRFRKKGLGSELLKNLEARLHTRGYRNLRVEAQTMNKAAVQFFSDRGYLPKTVTFRKRFDAGR